MFGIIQRGLAGFWSRRPATLQDILNLKNNIMSEISDFEGRLNASIDTINEKTDSVLEHVSGIGNDVAWLKDEIAKFQNSPGALSEADQKSLNAIEARVAGMVASADKAQKAAAELDAATETIPPVPTGTGDTGDTGTGKPTTGDTGTVTGNGGRSTPPSPSPL